MSIIRMFDASQLLDLCVSILIAFVLATLIGAERQWRQRNAGLRTNVLVAVGAAAFVTLGMRLNGQAGAVQIAAYVVSGIGFLGAGVIMKDGAQISGLNTAATLWCSAAVGIVRRRARGGGHGPDRRSPCGQHSLATTRQCHQPRPDRRAAI